MRNISFDDGYKSFTLNGDKDRVIRFNPADPNLIKRAKEAGQRIRESRSSLDGIELKADGTPEDELQETVKAINEFEAVMRDQFNYIFNSDVYDIVFAGQSPLCIVGENRVYLFEAFMDSAMQAMEEGIREYNKDSKARIAKYTEGL